jgi:hypothetical protein
MKFAAVALALMTTTAFAEVPVARVVDDAKAVDRVVEMTREQLPSDILRRIVTADIDLLRGRHPEGTFDYARYERLEAGRVAKSFSVQPTDPDRLAKVELKGDLIYRVVLEVPARRLFVAHNRPIWIDHLEAEFVPLGSSASKTQTVKVEAVLEPGTARTIDLDSISRQATIRVYARADKASGYGNLDVTLVQASIFDNTDSPYSDAVASAKSILKALDRQDLATMRAMAQRIVANLQTARPAERTVEVTAPRVPQPVIPSTEPEAGSADVLPELQAIEDLLTGSDAERRQGTDRLHQLIRKLRK